MYQRQPFWIKPAMFVIAFLFGIGNVSAQNVGSYGRSPRPGSVDPQTQEALKVTQNLGVQVPLDTVFYDHNKAKVTLGELMNGKPTILIPAYYQCPKLCNEVLNGVLTCLREMRQRDSEFTAGQAFNVITFSFDARENPERAGPKREYYLKAYDGRDPAVPGWWFLTASPGQFGDVLAAKESIRLVTETIGFPFVMDERGRDIQHPSAIMILTPDGRVNRYLMGIDFDATTVRRSLVEAADGKIGTKIDQLALLCFTYDEVTGHYKPAMRILGFAAAPFLFLVLGIAYTAWRRAKMEAKQPNAPGQS